MFILEKIGEAEIIISVKVVQIVILQLSLRGLKLCPLKL